MLRRSALLTTTSQSGAAGVPAALDIPALMVLVAFRTTRHRRDPYSVQVFPYTPAGSAVLAPVGQFFSPWSGG